MTRRIVRTSFQLGVLAIIVLLLIFLLDNRYRVLPDAIHTHLPAHHPGLVITDITVTSCSSINFFSSCKLDSEKWHRIEKDLYLGEGWLSKAYVHIKRKQEEELQPEDKVIIDVRVGRLDPVSSEKGQSKEAWESRPAGIWLKRSAKRHASDSQQAVTAVDVLFGADAVEPRPNWEIKGTPLLLQTSGEIQEARLSVRHGNRGDVEKPAPRIRADGKFKIMQASDLHLSTGLGKCRDPEPKGANGGKCDADPRTLDFVERLLDQEKPDLIILSGDQVNGETAPDAQSAVFKFADLFIKRKIPYASIYGNHDDEGDLPRSALMELTQTLPYSLSEPGPKDIDGVGNYFVEVLAHKNPHSALTIYLLDTHSYSPDERQYRGYDWLKPNQIKWFRDTAQRLKNSPSHMQYSHIHMNMAFIHIPLPEYRDFSQRMVGNRTENPTAPGFNTGFRDALVQERVLFVSCGHDHVNDYCMLSEDDRKPKLWMCYSGGAGFGGYGGHGAYHRRIRFFEVDTNENRIVTYKRLEWGDTAKRLDEQIIAEGGEVVAP